MGEVYEHVEAELENIKRVVAELPGSDSLVGISSLELAGVGALIHNFYNGVENILKQLVVFSGNQVPDNLSWHRDLINLVVSNNIISESTAEELKRYLAFRHFFSHGYSFDLDKERIIPLVKDIPQTLVSFTNEINKALRQR
jgi:uncharacterized protein YutE (UPF0331/DUF86 family)